MSQIKVDSIVDRNGANLTSLNGVTVTSDNYIGMRNRIINGDCRIDQRNAGASVTVGAGTYTLDRWYAYDLSDAVFTVQQNSSAPTGFVNSAKVTITTADASIGAAQYNYFSQRIEGFNVADLGWGTAGAKTITLSFWVRSSVTGTFGGALTNSAYNRSYPFTYSISVADTWEQKSVTITGDTSGTWLTDNGIGIVIHFDLGTGADNTGTAGAWVGAGNIGSDSTVQLATTLNATWYITGVQLEVGSVATPFERRPYGTELALCQRYYEKSYNAETAIGANTSTGAVLYTNPANINRVWCNVGFRVSKRGDPTVTIYSTTGASGNVRDVTVSVDATASSTSVSTPNQNGFNGYVTGSISGGSSNDTILGHWVASSEL